MGSSRSPMPPGNRRLLTKADAAAYLSISEKQLDELVAAKEIELCTWVTRAGTIMKMYPVPELDAFVARNLDSAVIAPIRKRGAA